MFVKTIIAKNFRSLKDIKIELKPGLNVLVGKNNAGKSNIIKAINYVLGETWPTYLNIEQKDFYTESDIADPSDFFLVAVKLEGRDINIDSLNRISRNVAIFEMTQPPNFNDIGRLVDDIAKLEGKRWATYPELGQELNNAEWLTLFLAVPREGKKQDRQYGMIYKQANRYYAIPYFSGEFRDALLTTVYVPSFRDPSMQLRINQYSWYGKLIRHLYEKRTDEQKEKIKGAQDTHSNVLGEVFTDATKDLQGYLSKAIFQNSVYFAPGTITRDDEYKQITLFIDDGIKTPYYDKGSGIQSALVIGLFSLYSKFFHRGSSLLLAEEPELYLHPQARRATEAQLAGFVEDGIENDKDGNPIFTHQVIISTHSPEFVRTAPLSDVAVIRRPKSQVQTKVYQTKKTLPKSQQIMYSKAVELVFADQVILVEGGEEYIVPPLCDILFEQKGWLDNSNISVIRVNGKGNFLTYTQILDELEIPWVILTDLDFLKDVVVDFKELFDEKLWGNISEIRDKLKQSLNQAKGKDVKDTFSTETRDWVKLYSQVKQVVQDLTESVISNEKREEIQALWGKLADRVEKPDYSILFANEENKSKLSETISSLRNLGVFVISHGELEDCFSDNGLSLGDSKDRRALEVAGKLLECKDMTGVSEWLVHYDDFEKMLSFVDQRLGVSDGNKKIN